MASLFVRGSHVMNIRIGNDRHVSAAIILSNMNRDTHSACRVLCGHGIRVATGPFTVNIHVRRSRTMVSRSRCNMRPSDLNLNTTRCSLMCRSGRSNHATCDFYVYPKNRMMTSTSRSNNIIMGNVDLCTQSDNITGDTVMIGMNPSSFNARPLSNITFRQR